MSCPYYTFKSGLLLGGDYWCMVHDRSVDTNVYNNYCKSYNYNECSIYRSKNPSSGCFITTVVCDILNKEDDCELLNDFRCFRDNVLQKNEQYYEYLQDYDGIGPVIANKLNEDNNRESIASAIYNNALIPIDNLLKDKKYDEACEKYYLMTLLLINYYGLKHLYNISKDSNDYSRDFESNTSGHGKRLVKVK